jgi:hypothetical protein
MKGGMNMKRTTVLTASGVALLLSLTFIFPQSSTGKEIIMMVGEIAAIDSMAKTVVVEVPIGKTMHEEKRFTVGGRLAPDAELIKDNRSAKLEEFKVGERVTVKWKSVETGHLILSLQSNPKE